MTTESNPTPVKEPTTQPRPTSPGSPAPAKDSALDLRVKDGLLLATVLRQGTSYVVTPKVTVPEKTGVYPNFLNGGSKQIFPLIARTHSTFRFWPVFENGLLVRLELSGVDDNVWIKDLRSPLVWALERAREHKS